MSTHIYGVVPGDDEKFEIMARIYNDCEKIGATVPFDVLEFFDHEKPDPKGLILGIKEAITECEGGFEVDITKLPKHVKFVRFVNKW
jgi:hypothetical protein